MLVSALAVAGGASAFFWCAYSTTEHPVRQTYITAPGGSAEILFAGDIHFAEDYFARREHWQARNVLERFGYEYPMAKLKALVHSTDLVVANLETPLSKKAKGAEGFGSMKYLHWTNPQSVLPVLSAFNLGAVNLANNHILDAGIPGFRETTDRLSRTGIASFGAGMNESEASEPYRIEIDFGSSVLRVAVLAGYWYRASYDEKHNLYAENESPGVRRLRKKDLVRQIKALKNNDPELYIIVFPHWGRNYRWIIDEQVRMAHALIEAGADMVIGQGAHHFQEIERYCRRWIIYNLGNFMFLTPGLFERNEAHPYSLAARISLSRDDARGDADIEAQVRLYVLYGDNRKSDLQTYVVSGDAFSEAVALLREASLKIPDNNFELVEGQDEVGSYLHLCPAQMEALPQAEQGS